MYVTDTFWISLCALFNKDGHYSNSIIMLRKWQTFEGGNAEWNPLNSTTPYTGATIYNTVAPGVHVWNYRTQEDGINATAYTLRNGNYPAIVWALENNVPIDSWSLTPIPMEVDTWGTHGFATYLRSMPPTPIPIPPQHTYEDDMYPYIVTNAHSGDYIVNADRTMVALGDGADLTAYQGQGFKVVAVSDVLFQNLKNNAPAAVVTTAVPPPPAV